MLSTQNMRSVPESCHEPLHLESSQSLPELICEHEECKKCVFCNDGKCREADSKSCMKKRLQQEKLGQTVSTSPFQFQNTPKTNEVLISPCQLARHNNKDSAWLLCGNIVYDVTALIPQHPGGEKSILKKAGTTQDCSKDMQFHSSRARKMLEKKKIGILCSCDRKNVDSQGESCIIS